MPTTVRAETVYRGRCSDCGWRDSSSDWATVDRLAADHDAMHVASRRIAPVIADRVFIHDAPGTEWFGVFWSAAAYAVKNGYSYLTWNGYVYDAVEADLGQQVCLAEDLPGERSTA